MGALRIWRGFGQVASYQEDGGVCACVRLLRDKKNDDGGCGTDRMKWQNGAGLGCERDRNTRFANHRVVERVAHCRDSDVRECMGVRSKAAMASLPPPSCLW